MIVRLGLSIAGTIIEFRSAFALCAPSDMLEEDHLRLLLKGFGYRGVKKPDIRIRVIPVRRMPSIFGWKPVFTARGSKAEVNWQLFSRKNTYRYHFAFEEQFYSVFVNSSFTRVEAYVHCPKAGPLQWNVGALVHHLVQVLLINYLAFQGSGVFLHACAVSDNRIGGMLFVGKSNSGKSTLARFWSGQEGAAVLNDDRAIVTRRGKRFLVHTGPWSGEFYDYFGERLEPAVLRQVYLISRAPRHRLLSCAELDVFSSLYTQTLLTFWNKKSLQNISAFLNRLTSEVPCSKLEFAKDVSVVGYLRGRK